MGTVPFVTCFYFNKLAKKQLIIVLRLYIILSIQSTICAKRSTLNERSKNES